MSKQPKKRLKKPPQNDDEKAEVLAPIKEEERTPGLLRHTRITASWSAPFLPPEIMKKYDDVAPDGAARLFKIFEDETLHRRSMESQMLRYQGRDLVVGKILALIFVLAVLAVIYSAIINNSPWVAAILGAGMLGTIAFGFFRVYGDGGHKKSIEDSTNNKKPQA